MITQICRYVRPTGRRCGSPALRGKFFCYFHNHAAILRKRERELADTDIHHKIQREVDEVFRKNGIVDDLGLEYFGYARVSSAKTLNFPALEDRASIQVALSTLLKALGQGLVNPKQASVMLYNLKIASQNLRGFDPDALTVTETTLDELGNTLAVDTDDPDAPAIPNNPENLPTTAADRILCSDHLPSSQAE